jgi:hypothetical protein
MAEKRRYVVWTGTTWWPTMAVSEAKAIANVEWRMRKMGKFPLRSQFEVKVADIREINK